MYNLIVDMWSDWVGKILLAILVTCLLLVCFLLFLLVDYGLSTNYTINDIIATKNYRAAYISTNMVLVGKVLMPQTQYHPAEYIFTLKDSDVVPRTNVEFGNKVQIGDRVKVVYSKGLTGNYYGATIIE